MADIENRKSRNQSWNPFAKGAAICIGLSVPLSQIGISYTTGLLATACILVVLNQEWRNWISHSITAAKTPFGLLLVVVFAAWIPSVIGSIDSVKSFQVWGRMAIYIALGTLLWSFLRGCPSSLKLCHIALIASSVFTLILVAVNFLGGSEFIRLLRFKEFTEGYPPVIMKHYASPAACLIPVLICIGSLFNRRVAIGCLLIAFGFIGFIYLTKSGSSLVGLFFGIYCSAVVWLGRRNPIYTVFGMTVLTLSLVGWFVWLVGQEALSVTTKQLQYAENLPFTFDQHRKLIWSFVISKVPDALWTGYGIDAINKVQGASIIIPILEAELLPSHPHSWLLEILAETGVIGFVPFIGALGMAFYSVSRRAIAGSQNALAAVALFGIYFGSGLTSFSFWASWWQLVFIILWAILLAMDGVEREEE